jgi:hypothetical protein
MMEADNVEVRASRLTFIKGVALSMFGPALLVKDLMFPAAGMASTTAGSRVATGNTFSGPTPTESSTVSPTDAGALVRRLRRPTLSVGRGWPVLLLL